MVTLSKIYTRGGDKGETSLGSGDRVAKHSIRVAAYGTSDEANAVIGIARLHAEGDADAMLARIQNDLFDLGADLCTPEGGARSDGALRVTAAQVKRLETEIDAMNEVLEPLKSFILPGGTTAGAARFSTAFSPMAADSGSRMTSNARARCGNRRMKPRSSNAVISRWIPDLDRRSRASFISSKLGGTPSRCTRLLI